MMKVAKIHYLRYAIMFMVNANEEMDGAMNIL